MSLVQDFAFLFFLIVYIVFLTDCVPLWQTCFQYIHAYRDFYTEDWRECWTNCQRNEKCKFWHFDKPNRHCFFYENGRAIKNKFHHVCVASNKQCTLSSGKSTDMTYVIGFSHDS